MTILGTYAGHDANACVYDEYRLLCALAQERMTRIKCDGLRYPQEAVQECLAQSGLAMSDVETLCIARGGITRNDLRLPEYLKRIFQYRDFAQRDLASSDNLNAVLDLDRIRSRANLSPKAGIYFYNHHFSHMIATLNAVDWADGLFYTSDGGGDYEFYGATLLREGRLRRLWPKVDTRTYNGNKDSLGILYATVTDALGFQRNRHEGKVLGLAAFGRPVKHEQLKSCYRVDEQGRVHGSLLPKTELRNLIAQFVAELPREDVAASVQSVLEALTIEALEKLIVPNKVRRLGVSGGVFANVKLTQRIQEHFQLDEVFVYPAMSDQGMSVGGCLEYLLKRDGVERWLENRRRLDDVYFGRDHTGEVDETFRQAGLIRDGDDFIAKSVDLLKKGKTIGTYIGRMEYGPRALGARTILAQATDRSINDWLNKKLERTEFMPFAPVVRFERAGDLFEIPDALAYSCQFMTATVNVRPEWRERIPAVVHVDGTARPQLIRREQNPLYYDVIHEYEKQTGIPALINTSFNVHEEPIINLPSEALRALKDKRIDYLLAPSGLWSD